MNRVTKKGIVFYASMKTGVSDKEVSLVVDAVYEAMRNALMRGDAVVMEGVGTLKPKFIKRQKQEIMSVHFRKSPKLRAKFEKVQRESRKVSSIQDALNILK